MSRQSLRTFLSCSDQVLFRSFFPETPVPWLINVEDVGAVDERHAVGAREAVEGRARVVGGSATVVRGLFVLDVGLHKGKALLVGLVRVLLVGAEARGERREASGERRAARGQVRVSALRGHGR